MSTSHYKQLPFFSSTSTCIWPPAIWGPAQSQILSHFINIKFVGVKSTKDHKSRKETKPINQKCKCCSLFFISGNFYFSFVSTSLAYITIPKNERKIKIYTWVKKLTTTYSKLKQLTLFLNCLLWRSDMQTLRL